MKKMLFPIYLKKTAVLALICLSLLSCGNNDEPGDVIEPANSIADFVRSNPDYSIFNAALEITNLKINLSGDKKYTVFAPNNTAFNAFLSTKGFSGLDAVSADYLTQILLNRVQEGVGYSSHFATGYISSLATAGASEENLSLFINLEEGILINGTSRVTRPDIVVDNGVIHAVNSVIELPGLLTFATADPKLAILLVTLEKNDDFDFEATLQSAASPAPFTVLAPTNDAFENLLQELYMENISELPSNVLTSALNYHIIPRVNLRSGDIKDGMQVTTFGSGILTLHSENNLTITNENGRTAKILAVDVQATNGVMYFIDTVFLPEVQF